MDTNSNAIDLKELYGDEVFHFEPECTGKKPWTRMGDLVGRHTRTRYSVFAKLLLTNGQRVTAKKLTYLHKTYLDSSGTWEFVGRDADEILEEIRNANKRAWLFIGAPAVANAIKASRLFGDRVTQFLGISSTMMCLDNGEVMDVFEAYCGIYDKRYPQELEEVLTYDNLSRSVFFERVDGVPLSAFLSTRAGQNHKDHHVVQSVKARMVLPAQVDAFKARIVQELDTLLALQEKHEFGQCDTRAENYMVTLRKTPDGAGLFDDVFLIMCDFDQFGQDFAGKQRDFTIRLKSKLTASRLLREVSSRDDSLSSDIKPVAAPPLLSLADGTTSRDSEDSEEESYGKRKNKREGVLQDMTNQPNRTKRTKRNANVKGTQMPCGTRNRKQTEWMNIGKKKD